ncbi:DUF6783 domain-containing protein [Fusicatenibacter sp.]
MKSPTNWDSQLTKSLFPTRSGNSRNDEGEWLLILMNKPCKVPENTIY